MGQYHNKDIDIDSVKIQKNFINDILDVNKIKIFCYVKDPEDEKPNYRLGEKYVQSTQPARDISRIYKYLSKFAIKKIRPVG